MDINSFLMLIFFVIFPIIILLIILIIKRKEILSFFWPGSWAIIEMLEFDNNVQSWLERKTEKLRFEFNGGKYNMYHTIETGDKVFKVLAPIYRQGRLAKFYYYEGESDPLDFRLEKATNNPTLNKQIEALELSKIFDEIKTPMQTFLEKYLIWIIVGIMALLFFTSGKG